MPIPYWAGQYIGLPFVEHGRSIYGLDCWGLVRLVMFEKFNLVLPDYSKEYSNTYSKSEISALIKRENVKWHEIHAGKEKLGDIIVLRMRGEPMHIGLVLGDSRMLHIERHVNSAIEPYNNNRWKDRIVGFYRHYQLGDKE